MFSFPHENQTESQKHRGSVDFLMTQFKIIFVFAVLRHERISFSPGFWTFLTLHFICRKSSDSF